MRYASAASARKKEYVVECQRMAYAHGGLYMLAWVPDTTDAHLRGRADRDVCPGDLFQPRPLPVEPFGDSLGVNTGRPETIVIGSQPRPRRTSANASGTGRSRSQTPGTVV